MKKSHYALELKDLVNLNKKEFAKVENQSGWVFQCTGIFCFGTCGFGCNEG